MVALIMIFEDIFQISIKIISCIFIEVKCALGFGFSDNFRKKGFQEKWNGAELKSATS
jgi:hypothetical protein